MRLKYKIMLALIVVAMGLCFMTLQSYALWIARYASGDNIVGVGCYSVSFTEDVEHGPISLNNTYPVSDATALSSGVYYSFTIRNTCTTASGYAITINPLTTNTLAKNKIKYALYKTTDTAPSTGINLGTVTEYNTDLEGYSNAALISESIILDTGYLGPGTTSNAVDGESVTYRLYLWMDENDTLADKNKIFEASVYVSNYARAKEKTSSDTLALLQSLNPNITLTQSTSVNPNFARPAPQSSAGRTYSSDYRSLANASDTYITYASDYTYDELTGVYSLIDYTTCQYGDCFEDLIDGR